MKTPRGCHRVRRERPTCFYQKSPAFFFVSHSYDEGSRILIITYLLSDIEQPSAIIRPDRDLAICAHKKSKRTLSVTAHTSARDAPASTRSSPHGTSTPQCLVSTSFSRSSRPSPSPSPPRRSRMEITTMITLPRLLTPRRTRRGPAPPSAPIKAPKCVHPPHPSISGISRECPSVSSDPPALDSRRRSDGLTYPFTDLHFHFVAPAASLRRRQVRREGGV